MELVSVRSIKLFLVLVPFPWHSQFQFPHAYHKNSKASHTTAISLIKRGDSEGIHHTFLAEKKNSRCICFQETTHPFDLLLAYSSPVHPVLSLSPQGSLYRNVSELQNIIRQSSKERLQLERHLARATEVSGWFLRWFLGGFCIVKKCWLVSLVVFRV